MTRMSKQGKLRAIAGGRHGKTREAVLDVRINKLCKTAGEEDSLKWIRLVKATPTAIRKLQNLARAKGRQAKPTQSKSIDLSISRDNLKTQRYFPTTI